MRKFYLSILLFTVLLTGAAKADGMFIPFEPTPILLGDLYTVKYHHVKVDIQDQLATTTIEQAFQNETGRSIEMQYVFPVPLNAQLNKFSIMVGEREVPGKILSKDEARKVYEELVRKQRDPAMLEYIGQGMFQTSVFPLQPGELKKVRIVYTELLKKDGNRVEYVYPLNTEKFSKNDIEEVSVKFNLTSAASLKNVYSPSHELNLDWNGNTKVAGEWSEKNVKPDSDFRLFWTLSDDEVGATLFTYRPDGKEDGYFLFLASPKADAGGQKVIAKNIVLVVDVSGSMSGEKMEQARDAAKFVAQNLNPQDRFNIIFYDDEVETLWPSLKDYTAENKREALAKIEKAEADGSTDIHAALVKAMGQFKDSSRPNFIIFLTDGLPTAGVTELEGIVKGVNKANRFNAKLFAFGVGYDVNAVLLDKLGVENHGFAEYVRPGENIEGAVSGFYGKIQNPALTDVALDFGGLVTKDIYPKQIPDLFRGGQLVVVGRYAAAGKKTITITGKVGEKTNKFTYDLDFAQQTDREQYAFVARLWAQKKIGWLIEQIRLHGENDEYINEIVKLSTRYGIMTEYTSFIADEGVRIDDVAANNARAKTNLQNRTSIQTGSGGVNQAIQSGTMQKAAQAPNKAAYLNEAGEEVQLDSVRIIGSKTFYLKKGVWIDSEYREGMKLIEVKQFDNPYFELANNQPTQAQYMSFAPKEAIIVVIGGVAYKITAPK